ncbi:MAG: OmpA family protein [Firmicutes bacterium]|nr:OmpA family protein [Bacillota bacterium]
MKRLALCLSALVLAVGCQKPKPTFEVEVKSTPSPAILKLDGKDLGQTPAKILLLQDSDVARVQADFQGQVLVEQRIRFLPGDKVELVFLFGEDRSAIARALNLKKVLVFEFAAGLTFDVNKAELKPSTLPLLARQAELLNSAFKDVTLYVCGHTDSTGRSEHNLQLSLERAKTVSQYLESQGVAKSRLRTQGYAADYPLADNATEDGRAQNRRTEIVIGL